MKPEDILAKHGLSRTSIRTKLIQILAEAHEALSSKEIEQQLDDNVDRVTIYRTIKLFEDKGLIHKIVVDEQSTKYRLIRENKSTDHPHFHCIKCDKVVCLPDTPLPCCDLPQGFRVSTQNTIIEGTCQKCNK
ncbi:Fur family transcriptional regulator [Carboxylicivirga linearis]|uniref:Transcriptional repressor n=1 Tax=Carboxylicivirga linearis TaxID=1628157 RepID=A0ABS5JPS7_9BACT|nr:transcriptional repressor [Carboxylicivirga linearis]MBS2096898.1 transcriptional repressor [Carboxylicivirga linearis]